MTAMGFPTRGFARHGQRRIPGSFIVGKKQSAPHAPGSQASPESVVAAPASVKAARGDGVSRRMRRRTFIKTGAAALAAAAWPGWIRRAFADASLAAGAFADGERRARSSGKPLLVLIAPDDPGESYRRGRLFASMIDDISDEERAPLALVEVVCAPLADLRGRGVGERTVAAVIDGGRAVAIEPSLVIDGRFPGDPEAAGLLAGLARVVLADAELPRLARRAVARLTPDELLAVRAALADARRPPPPLALADRAAAEIAMGARIDRRPDLRALLGRAAAARLRGDPPGARWEMEDPCPGCGMARATAPGRRFLRLFAKREPV